MGKKGMSGESMDGKKGKDASDRSEGRYSLSGEKEAKHRFSRFENLP
jgi:hypothetical protein